MGDPRKHRRKYERPTHPWKSDRINEEKEICRKYGLKNRKELWRVKSKIRRYRQQARNLLASSGEEVMKEKKELFDKLKKLGIIENPTVEDILAINAENLLDRRLQSLVYSKGLANTIKEARQLVTHNHVMVGKGTVNIPSYTVSKGEETRIQLREGIRALKSRREEEQKKKEKPKPESKAEETKKPREEEKPKEKPKKETKVDKEETKPENRKEEGPKGEAKESEEGKAKEKAKENSKSKEDKKTKKEEAKESDKGEQK